MNEVEELKTLNIKLIKELYKTKRDLSGVKFDLFSTLKRGEHKKDDYLDKVQESYAYEYKKLTREEEELISSLDS